ncbi:hypothetical protein [Streptomyces sp. SAJ15]|uniref:hypothetical protein n=1 Tax=Streptomyces sp. SAJ15 TaxID=2011095 RepID=UPI001185D737|nr:hypothetical protein [Streptomyces sp. SAJ15]TVL92466.1 hypothetical protein CD790_12345 [Streptomyces sp. SAJ15]
MRIAKKVVTAVAALGLAGAGLVVGAGTAAAGTNGQQIRLTDASSTIMSMRVSGPAHNGQWSSGCFNRSGMTILTSGWWWKGDVRVEYYHGYGCTNYWSADDVHVPADQGKENWVYLYKHDD